jgi:hypothetical protein
MINYALLILKPVGKRIVVVISDTFSSFTVILLSSFSTKFRRKTIYPKAAKQINAIAESDVQHEKFLFGEMSPHD